jgi:hypothetical protein
MPRKIIVRSGDGPGAILLETPAADELQLQELIKENPDLLPVEEFEMTGPLLVVGRETGVASGAVDLVAIAKDGEILIVEFKTGPQNSDFRRVLAQLIDYGSHLWSLSYEDFDAAVPVRYFNDRTYCKDPRLFGKNSLQEAAEAVWLGITSEEFLFIRDRISEQLRSGGFHYVIVAQRFTDAIERTAEYLNQTMPRARFYAVELVRFVGNIGEAFEARTVFRPSVVTPPPPTTNEQILFSKFADPAMRESASHLLEGCRGMGYRLYWGTTGVSIQLPVPDRAPLTVAWLFPPDGSGWMALKNLTLGYGQWTFDQSKSSQAGLTSYLRGGASLPGAQPVTTKALRDTGFTFAPEAVVSNEKAISQLLGELMQTVNGTV